MIPEPVASPTQRAAAASSAAPFEVEVVEEGFVSQAQRPAGSLGGLTAWNYRVSDEAAALYGTLAAFAAILFLLSLASLGVFIVLAIVAAVCIKNAEGRLVIESREITPQSNPALDCLLRTAAQRLAAPVPRAYVKQDSSVNAGAIGFFSTGSVVLHSRLVELFPPEALLFVIGHEIAHIQCGHTNWLVFTDSAERSLSGSLAPIFSLLFKAWSRKGEFSADRGGLVACGNPAEAMNALALLELANGCTPEQLQSWLASPGIPDDVFGTHPETANRIRAIAALTGTEIRPVNS